MPRTDRYRLPQAVTNNALHYWTSIDPIEIDDIQYSRYKLVRENNKDYLVQERDVPVKRTRTRVVVNVPEQLEANYGNLEGTKIRPGTESALINLIVAGGAAAERRYRREILNRDIAPELRAFAGEVQEKGIDLDQVFPAKEETRVVEIRTETYDKLPVLSVTYSMFVKGDYTPKNATKPTRRIIIDGEKELTTGIAAPKLVREKKISMTVSEFWQNIFDEVQGTIVEDFKNALTTANTVENVGGVGTTEFDTHGGDLNTFKWKIMDKSEMFRSDQDGSDLRKSVAYEANQKGLGPPD